MQKQTLTLKITFIFIIPALALIYFSYFFVQDKYNKLEKNRKYQFATIVLKKMDTLIHNIQIERGLSAGYLAVKSSDLLKSRLVLQHQTTDKAYQDVKKIIELKSDTKTLLRLDIGYKTKPIMKDVMGLFKEISDVRKEVLTHSISFKDEITFYSLINKKLLDSSLTLVFILQKFTNDNLAIIKLQKIQEYAGQERAYVYNQLLSKNLDLEIFKKIEELQKAQKENLTEFIINASLHSIELYQNIFEFDSHQSLNELRAKFIKKELSSKDANLWFSASTNHIDMLSGVVSKILDTYIIDAQKRYDEALKMLYVTLFLWVLSFIALIGLLYILKRMIAHEEKTAQELRIAAYTFDSHEAMTITDVNGTIVKVNKAFTKITGYTEDEVIGENPRVLKSTKHSNEFYQEMWHKLNTVGRWSDDIYNKRKNGEIYPERLSITAIKDERGITTHYIAQFFDISDIVKAQEQAEYQITHDFLTGLVNRKQLSVRLVEEYLKAKRHDFKNAFLFIDLDYFKKVNDTHGHSIGDILLKKFSQRVLETVREEDLVARISGDEFGVLLSNLDQDEMKATKSVKIVAQKILDEVAKPFIINDLQLYISTSIGIKIFPADENSIDDVTMHADTAMYKAKYNGKNNYVFFNKDIANNLKRQLEVESEIQSAIENDEFEFFFQPKVDVKSGKIYGAELLARWRHPLKGLLFPDSFIDIATEMGIIHKITIQALHTACKTIIAYGDLFKGSLAININSQELLENNFELEVINIIASYNIDPARIELEILEDDIIKEFDLIVHKMKKLKEFGVRFSIDDFGTGYSSITYLKRLPVDTLKIDRSFLMDAHSDADQELIDVIVKMAKLFHLEVVAEGVENSLQLQCIKDNETELYQGYLFSKPIELTNFLELLKSKHEL